MILKSLSEEELSFLLRLLNAADAETEVLTKSASSVTRVKARVSASEGQYLDKIGEKLRKSYEKGRVSEAIRPPAKYFATPAEDRKITTMCHEWSLARFLLVRAVVDLRNQPGNFVHLLVVGVPAHHPPVMVNDPTELVSWMIARGMANRQLRRLVRCSRKECHKFGLRDRAKRDAKFCSVDCQKEFNFISRKLGKDSDYGAV
jgi:hypothetical protein